MNRREFLSAIPAFGVVAAAGSAQAAWQAGVATVDITPDRSLWMAGFARRKQAAQGTALPLHAKALALKSGGGRTAVLVTMDLLGITARMSARVSSLLERRHRIRRSDVLFNASHTHCGPIVDEQLSVAYDLSPRQWADIRAYTTQLETSLAAVAGEALARLRPAAISYGRGQAGFAANRRIALNPDGPVDHSVPILRVDTATGEPLAVVFGYACHNTTLQDGFVQYHGDYAGVAQAVLEQRHPGMTALFVAGCGADINPAPRGTLELVQSHGAALADAVDRGIASTHPIAPLLRTAYTTVDLAFVDEAARERWRRQLKIEDVYLQRHAALMRAALARNGRLPSVQPDPVQVWRFGPDANSGRLHNGNSTPPPAGAMAHESSDLGLTLVALGGEVVVDYALRLTREYPQRRLWVSGYSNDVFGYVPSLRVLREGGYEGGDAMIYYGRPAPFAESVEERIVAGVGRLVRTLDRQPGRPS